MLRPMIARRSAPTAPIRRQRLSLEPLEGRDVPAAFSFLLPGGIVGSGSFTPPAAGADPAEPTQAIPVPDLALTVTGNQGMWGEISHTFDGAQFDATPAAVYEYGEFQGVALDVTGWGVQVATDAVTIGTDTAPVAYDLAPAAFTFTAPNPNGEIQIGVPWVTATISAMIPWADVDPALAEQELPLPDFNLNLAGLNSADIPWGSTQVSARFEYGEFMGLTGNAIGDPEWAQYIGYPYEDIIFLPRSDFGDFGDPDPPMVVVMTGGGGDGMPLVWHDNRPVVWVDDRSGNMSEGTPGLVILHRGGGNLDQSLTVTLAVASERAGLTPAEDGGSSPVVSRTVTVTFSPGQDTATTDLLSDPAIQPDPTQGVAIGLLPGAHYVIGEEGANAVSSQPGGGGPIEYYDVHFALLFTSVTRKTLAQQFAATVEHMPIGWVPHHSKMQALRARYLNEKGIVIDEMQYLRGVHPVVHAEIGDAQDKWRRQMMKQMNLNPAVAGNTATFWATVPWNEVEKFEKSLEETYGKYFLKTGATQADTRAILNLVDGERLNRKFFNQRGSRFAKLFPSAAVALGLFTVIGDAAAMGTAIVGDPPEARAAWVDFEAQYRSSIEAAMNGRQMTWHQGNRLVKAYDAYLKAIQSPDDARNLQITAMYAWVDQNLTKP